MTTAGAETSTGLATTVVPSTTSESVQSTSIETTLMTTTETTPTETIQQITVTPTAETETTTTLLSTTGETTTSLAETSTMSRLSQTISISPSSTAVRTTKSSITEDLLNTSETSRLTTGDLMTSILETTLSQDTATSQSSTTDSTTRTGETITTGKEMSTSSKTTEIMNSSTPVSVNVTNILSRKTVETTTHLADMVTDLTTEAVTVKTFPELTEPPIQKVTVNPANQAPENMTTLQTTQSSTVTEPQVQTATDSPINQTPVNVTTTQTTKSSTTEELIVPVTNAPVQQPNAPNSTIALTTVELSSTVSSTGPAQTSQSSTTTNVPTSTVSAAAATLTTFTTAAALSTGSPELVDFTFNLTLLDVSYNPQFENPSTEIYRIMSAILISLVNPVFQNTSIGAAYAGCRNLTFRIGNVPNSFSINCICSYMNNTDGQIFDRTVVYKEFSNLTSGIKRLAKYPLDSGSLYIDGYNEPTISMTTMAFTRYPSTTSLQNSVLTVNFTLTNLKYQEDFGNPNSGNFIMISLSITNQLDAVMKNTSLKTSFSSCQIINLTNSENNTKVDAICSYTNKSETPFDSVNFYQELKNETYNVTKLGVYTLDSNSLYVNGYNEQTLPSPTPSQSTKPTVSDNTLNTLTLNFTVTNIPYTADMGTTNTSIFNSTQLSIITLLNSVINKTGMKDSSPVCKVERFMLANSKDTKVDAICMYTNYSGPIPFNTIAFYKELKNQTNNVTTLGIYTLDPNSLYVNGYNEKQPSVPATSPPVMNNFTLNFTITNLNYTSDLGVPFSSDFNSTVVTVTSQLNNLMKNTSLGTSYTGCQIVSFGSSDTHTKVNAVCTYMNDSGSNSFDRVAFFKELASKMNSATKLGIYSIEPGSLYVNGYNEAPTVEPPIEMITKTPVESTAYEDFTLNFTITNLIYTFDLGIQNTAKYNVTTVNVLQLITNLMKNSTVSSKLIGCSIDGFALSDVNNTKVNSICRIKKDITGAQFDRVNFYNEVMSMTENITKLGMYTLDKNSLYVNGYNKVFTVATTQPPTTLTTLKTFGPKSFFINFTITNFPYSSNLTNKYSDQYTKLQTLLNKLLNDGFRNNSNVKDNFDSCAITGFRSTKDSTDTTAESVCTFNVDLLARVFTEEDVKQAFLNITQDGTILGNFTLKGASIHVNIYRTDADVIIVSSTIMTTPPTTTTTTTPTTTTTKITTTTSAIIEAIPSNAYLGYAINFTITNNYVPADPEQRRILEQDIVQKMNELYKNSALGKKFKYCLLASMRNGSIIASCNCYFEDDPAVNTWSVNNEFNSGTETGKVLGSIYPLRDITVTEIARTSDLPFWVIILICLAVLFALVLIFLIIFLLLLCLRRRKQSYDVQQSIYGTYFPHLNMRKLY
ncbi:mucin-16-like [Rhinoderma darwinii]|uniref:mucin-16-like n=1 Tax=Rhinoderma darwinii TaxID=43563 RepID=UPI003F66C601